MIIPQFNNHQMQRKKSELKLEAQALLEAIENNLIVVGPNHGGHINIDSMQYYVDKLRDTHKEIFDDNDVMNEEGTT
jgi:hypothetical protein